MIQALITGIVIFALSFVILDVVEWGIHRLTHNRDVSYRWGVWTFAILAGLYGFFTSLGR